MPAVALVVFTCHCVIVPVAGIVYCVLGSLASSAITVPLQPAAVEPLGIADDPSVVFALALPALARTSAADRTVIHESLARTFHLFSEGLGAHRGAIAGRQGSPAVRGTERR